MIITLPLFLAGMQIGGKVGSTLLKEKNPNLARNIETLVGSFTAGAQGMTDLAGAFGSPNITQTPTPTEGSGLQIGGAVGKITNQTQQNFSGWGMNKGFLGDTLTPNKVATSVNKSQPDIFDSFKDPFKDPFDIG